METPTLPVRYTDLEQQRFIDQWKQSGKSKASFCREYELSYFSFNDWIKRRYKKEQKQKSLFLSVKAFAIMYMARQRICARALTLYAD